MNLDFMDFYEVEKPIGFGEQRIQLAENRLNISIPKKLRDFYLLYAKDKTINSCHAFEQPGNLDFLDKEWLVFYIEAQGVCVWAVNQNDFGKKEQPIYINFDGMGFVKEAANFEDFLVIRATLDYSKAVYPYRFYLKNVTQYQIEAKQPNNPYPFFIKSFSGTFEEQVEGFLTFLENAFNHPTLLGTIQGSEWGYFPFNWGTHK